MNEKENEFSLNPIGQIVFTTGYLILIYIFAHFDNIYISILFAGYFLYQLLFKIRKFAINDTGLTFTYFSFLQHSISWDEILSISPFRRNFIDYIYLLERKNRSTKSYKINSGELLGLRNPELFVKETKLRILSSKNNNLDDFIITDSVSTHQRFNLIPSQDPLENIVVNENNIEFENLNIFRYFLIIMAITQIFGFIFIFFLFQDVLILFVPLIVFSLIDIYLFKFPQKILCNEYSLQIKYPLEIKKEIFLDEINQFELLAQPGFIFQIYKPSGLSKLFCIMIANPHQLAKLIVDHAGLEFTNSSHLKATYKRPGFSLASIEDK